MKLWTLRQLDRFGAPARVTLLTVATLVVAIGWAIGPFFLPPFDSWANLRNAAAIPITIWGLLDAIWDFLRRRREKQLKSIIFDIDVILLELEDLAVQANHSLRLSECAVKVWAVRRRSLWECIKREKRKPLTKVTQSSLLRETHSSGLRWRVGMGVMGSALHDNNPLAVDVSHAWAAASDRSESSWEALPEASRLGLNHEEFLKLARSTGPLGPFVLAVPYFEGGTALGVVALDMNPNDAKRIKLGEPYDDVDKRVTQLLYALAKGAFSE